jgi:hypothetical protein
MNETSRDKGTSPEAAETVPSAAKGFTGVFSGLDLPNLVQMLAMNAFSGALRLGRGEDVGELFFRAGEIVHAACGPVTGMEGFSRILGWESGQIHLEPNAVPAQETIDMPWHALLIQTMAKIEDGKAKEALAEEPPPPPRAPQATETLQLNTFFSIATGWPEVASCMVLSADKGEIIRPSVALPKMREWAETFTQLFQQAQGLRVPGQAPGPIMMSVTLEKRHWILVPHSAFLVALEVSRGMDFGEMARKVRLVLRQGG